MRLFLFYMVFYYIYWFDLFKVAKTLMVSMVGFLYKNLLKIFMECISNLLIWRSLWDIHHFVWSPAGERFLRMSLRNLTSQSLRHLQKKISWASQGVLLLNAMLTAPTLRPLQELCGIVKVFEQKQVLLLHLGLHVLQQPFYLCFAGDCLYQIFQ